MEKLRFDDNCCLQICANTENKSKTPTKRQRMKISFKEVLEKKYGPLVVDYTFKGSFLKW